jgi:zinc protease
MTPLLTLVALAHAGAPSIPYTEYTLPNGLHVVLLEDHSLPQVVVDVWYRVGSKDEVAGRSGFAHLFEHLMFMGTTRLPGDGFDAVMEAHGGSNNAWTMEDATNYHESGPPNLLETFLWMEADRMEGLGKAMTQEKLDRQRDIVRNERRQSYEDQPYGVAWLKMPELLYPAGHPYAHTVIGTHEDLQAAGVQDVTDFFSTWYVPNNATLVVAGDFSPDAVRPVIERTFASLPRRDTPARPKPAPVTRPVQANTVLDDDVPVPQVNLLWHTPAAYTQDDGTLQLVASLLGGGESSRLYQALVPTGLAQGVEVAQMSQALGGVFIISVTAMEGVDLKQIEDVVRAELTRLATTPPSAEEVARLKNQYELGFLGSLESLLERAELLARYDAYTGSPDHLAKDLARFRDATAEGLMKATAAYLDPQTRARIEVRPAPATATTETK